MGNLQLTTVHDGGLDVRADSTAARAKSLDLLDDLEGSVVGNLAEDDVLAVQPGGHDGGDEELGAVAAGIPSLVKKTLAVGAVKQGDLRVGTSVGHGEDTGLGVLVDEVLIGELLTIDGAATGALQISLDVCHGKKQNGERHSRCGG